jgi:anti-anti-sigma factor
MGMEPLLSTRIELKDGVAWMPLRGELDLSTAPALADCLADLEHDDVAEIVIDLQGLTFLGVAGLRAFEEARERAEMNGHRLVIVGASPFARRLFQLTGSRLLLEDRGSPNLVIGRSGDLAYADDRP